MPSLSQTGSGTGGTILTPGNKTVLDNGVPSQFGQFKVVNTTQQVLEGLGVVMGIYGKGGVGKTTLVCSLADRKLNPEGYDLPMCILDSESGVKSVANLVGPDLQQIPFTSFADIETFVATARAGGKANFPWKSLVWDNVSAFVQKALQEQGFHGPGGTSSQPDYGAMTTRVTMAIQSIRDLALEYGVNMFLLFWESTERTPTGNIVGYRADVTPKLGTRIVGILDYIGYLSVVPRSPWDRKLDFSPNPELDSKVRFTRGVDAEALPFEMYNPDMVSILNTLKRGAKFPTERYLPTARAR